MAILRAAMSITILCASATSLADSSRVWFQKPLGEEPSGQSCLPPAEHRDLEGLSDALRDTEHAFVFIHGPSCPASASAQTPFAVISKLYGRLATFCTVSTGDYEFPANTRTPTFLYFKRGKLQDKAVGYFAPDGAAPLQLRIKQLLEAFVFRNVYGFAVAEDLHFLISGAKASELLRRTMVNVRTSTPLVKRDADLKGIVVSGSVLLDADFRGSNLEGAEFWSTDLTGARLEGANLRGTIWMNSICPDGHRVTDHRASCEDHLRRPSPKRGTAPPRED